MLFSRRTLVAFASLAALTMLVGTAATAQVPFLGAGLKKLAYQGAAKELAPIVTEASPINLDWNNLYPTVDRPPGGPFHSSGDPRRIREQHAYLLAQMAKDPTATIALRPGDYVFFMRAYCTHSGPQGIPAHPKEPWPESFELAPLNGRRASVLPALYARAQQAHVSYRDTQLLVWAITNGVTYEQMQPEQQALFTKLVPQYRSSMEGDPVQRIRSRWDEMRHKMPLLPSLDAAVDKLGAVGNTIRSLEEAQRATIANATNFEQSKATLAPQTIKTPAPIAVKSWSQLSDTVYAKIKLPRNYRGIGSLIALQVRVLPAAAAADERGRGSAPDFDSIAKSGASGGGFGGNSIGMPSQPNTQPITMGPAPTGIGGYFGAGMAGLNAFQNAWDSAFNSDPGLPPGVLPVWDTGPGVTVSSSDPGADTGGNWVFDGTGLHK
jgi:hypothetical protein